MKIFIDCYTVNSLDLKIPESTHVCTSIDEEAIKHLRDRSRPDSGIKKIEIWFDHSTERVSKVDTDGVGG